MRRDENIQRSSKLEPLFYLHDYSIKKTYFLICHEIRAQLVFQTACDLIFLVTVVVLVVVVCVHSLQIVHKQLELFVEFRYSLLGVEALQNARFIISFTFVQHKHTHQTLTCISMRLSLESRRGAVPVPGGAGAFRFSFSVLMGAADRASYV